MVHQGPFQWYAAALAGTRATVAEQHYRPEGQGYRNLVARFGPATGPVVVVGAHYDVFGALPGADDNASGVAGLLELARMLDAHGPELATAVELVAYSTEEPPFFGGRQMGSSVHARGLQAGGAEVRAMIALEMIGYFTAEQPHISPLLDLLYPRSGDFVLVVGRWSDRGLVRRVKSAFRGTGTVRAVSYTGPRIVGTDWSDHSSYGEEGYPAVMITDTAFFRNPHYHLQGDTPDTLDYRRMAGVVDGVLAAVVRLAGR